MKSQSLLALSLLIITAFILTACNIPITSGVTPNPGLVFTEAAKTEQAQPTKAPPTPFPTAVFTEVLPATATAPQPSATSTTVPTATPTVPATPTSISGTCTDQMTFVSDVTIPDDTEMLPGEEFTKTWRLQNTGTCTWTSHYAAFFVSGDQMNGTSPQPLSVSIAPNATVDISIKLKAPGTTGTYQSNWQMKNASGAIFGLGNNSDEPFYVKIKVVEGAAELNLGTPTWLDNMDNANNWYLLDTENTKFTEGDGVLQMKSIKPGSSEEWDLSSQPALKDFYLQANFITGDTCSGLDKYGLLTRASDVNKGYVFEFSCDGHYRLYTWDGKNYVALQEWIGSPSIQPGAKQTNVMGIWMKGTTIRLYANGHKLAELTDNTFDQGQFGLVIGSVNTPNFTVSVDQVEYWKFNP